jgi:hypothetical protein
VQRSQLWRQLHHIQPHPISRHIHRQLHKQHLHPPILIITMVWGCIVFFSIITLFSKLTIILLPLFLMAFSSGYILPWLYRIAKAIKQQYNDSVIDTMSVVPPGHVFIMFAICHSILNEGDRLGWIQLLRNIIVVVITMGIIMATLITAALVESVVFEDIVLLLTDIVVLSTMLYVEHQQSILIVCLLAVILPRRATHQGDLVSNMLISFIVLQFLTALIPLLVTIGLAAIGSTLPLFSVSGILFLVIRESVLYGLWRIAGPFE